MKTPVQEAQLALQEASLQSQAAENSLSMLKSFVHDNKVAELELAVAQREYDLARAQDALTAAKSRGGATLSLAEMQYHREQDRLAKLDDQIVKAKIYAPRDGIVAYPNDADEPPIKAGTVVREPTGPRPSSGRDAVQAVSQFAGFRTTERRLIACHWPRDRLDAQLVGALLKLHLAELDGLEGLVVTGLLDLGGELLLADGDLEPAALGRRGDGGHDIEPAALVDLELPAHPVACVGPVANVRPAALGLDLGRTRRGFPPAARVAPWSHPPPGPAAPSRYRACL